MAESPACLAKAAGSTRGSNKPRRPLQRLLSVLRFPRQLFRVAHSHKGRCSKKQSALKFKAPLPFHRLVFAFGGGAGARAGGYDRPQLNLTSPALGPGVGAIVPGPSFQSCPGLANPRGDPRRGGGPAAGVRGCPRSPFPGAPPFPRGGSGCAPLPARKHFSPPLLFFFFFFPSPSLPSLLSGFLLSLQ